MIIEGVTYPILSYSRTPWLEPLHLTPTISPRLSRASFAYIIRRTTTTITTATSTTDVKQEKGKKEGGKNWTSLEAFSTSNNNYRSIIPFQPSLSIFFSFFSFFLLPLSLFSLMVHREKGFCQREFLCVSQYFKGKNEKGGEKKRRRRKAGNSYFHGISTIAVRIRAHYSPLLGPGLAPPRTATDGRSHNVVHTLPRVLREIRKPRNCARRATPRVYLATFPGASRGSVSSVALQNRLRTTIHP